MQLEHRLSALIQLHLQYRLNTWLQWIEQRQLQDKTRNIGVLEFGASDIKGLTVYALYVLNAKVECFVTSKMYDIFMGHKHDKG